MKTTLWSCLVLTLALAGPAIAQQASSSADFLPVKIIQTTKPRFPLRLQNTQVLDGEASVVVKIDAEGRLADWLVIGYTRSEFAEAAVESLKSWQYEPATLKGEKRATVREVHFRYSRTGVVISLIGFEASPRSTRVYRLSDLDRIPVPQKVVSPGYPESLVATGVKGSVTVEFYIDAAGQVRMPAAVEWPNDLLADLAVAAVKQWQFEPPLRNGQPVLVLARQEFSFLPKS